MVGPERERDTLCVGNANFQDVTGMFHLHASVATYFLS